MMNKYRLAAVSNYKLAQLTFSTLDNGSLKKTALIKNMVTQLYDTNEDWINDMTRWDFFTPESLETMSQRDIERIIQRYMQVIHNQSPIQVNDRTTSFYYPQLRQPPFAEIEEDDVDIEDEIEETIHYYSPPPSPPLSRCDDDGDDVNDDDTKSTKTGTTTTLTKNLAAELMNLFDMEFCLDLSLPTYRRSNSFDEPRYPPQVTDYLPKRVSSLEYRRSRSSEPSLIDDDDDYDEDDDERSMTDSDSLETIELELEVDARSSSVFSELFTSFTQTKNKRQKSIKRFFSSFSKVPQPQHQEEVEGREREHCLVTSQSTFIHSEEELQQQQLQQQQLQQQQQQQPKLTRSKSVGTKFLKRIKSFKKI